MTTSLLRRTLQVVGVRVEPKKVGKVVKKLHAHLLNLPRLQSVVPDPVNANMKLVLLNTNAQKLQPVREQLQAFLHTESFSFARHQVHINYPEDQDAVGERINANKDQEVKTENVSFLPIDNDNLQQLHALNEKLFPIKYNEAFYEYVPNAPDGFCKLACTDDGTAIGAVCCEVEPVKISNRRRERLCILTIGVTEEHRRSRIGSDLLKSVIKQAVKGRISYVYLHVQCSNTVAQKFYLQHGFTIARKVRDYYSQIDSPHAFILRKQLARKP
ncbi:N-alpha-acetyltransferase 50 [Phytophthora boehmeriae]|uniref:N-alpha-acetyltransferase 50 n=1 Tax=Phytophthora boehmeriae TaxID=109152 RepID=A0A8T1X1K9_9STRA|nr:N-alpha-acetyltransferase 50 [Phytophthora boehmeriae]